MVLKELFPLSVIDCQSGITPRYQDNLYAIITDQSIFLSSHVMRGE